MGTRLTRMRLAKRFSGDVEGESAAKRLMAYGSEEGSAAHVGLEARDRQRHRRSSSFVLRHGAAMERGVGAPAWPSCSTPARASCAVCAARRRSPWSPEAGTPSRLNTTSSKGLTGISLARHKSRTLQAYRPPAHLYSSGCCGRASKR